MNPLQYSVILAFDVKVERDAQEMADNMGVKIFQVGCVITKHGTGKDYTLGKIYYTAQIVYMVVL